MSKVLVFLLRDSEEESFEVLFLNFLRTSKLSVGLTSIGENRERKKDVDEKDVKIPQLTCSRAPSTNRDIFFSSVPNYNVENEKRCISF